MEYILPKPYLSASSIGTLLNCPKQFEFRYIKGIINPPNAALVTGTAMHRTLETYYKDAMMSKERLTGAQTAELAVSSLDEVLDEQETTVSDIERDDAIKSLQGLAKVYVDRIGCNIEPVAVEEEIRYTSACGVPILAYLDLRHKIEDPVFDDNGIQINDSEGICDYKITSKKWTYDRLRNSLQFNMYAMITGVGDIQIHNMIKTAPKGGFKLLPDKPEIDGVRDVSSNHRVLHHRFDGAEIDHLENLIETSARLITSGIFMPTSLDSWCCTPDWCGYWHLCRGSGACNVKYVDMRSSAASSSTDASPAATV